MLARLLDWTAVHVTGPLDRWRTGNRSFRYVRDVERVNASDREAIRSHQLTRLRAICTHAVRESEFYRERFHRAGIRDPASLTLDQFATLPLLTRSDLRDHAEAIRSRSHPAETLRASATGGSTSAPVPIYMDWDAAAHRGSATIAFNRWFGVEPGRRMAYLWGAPRDFEFHKRLRARLRNALVTRSRWYPSMPLDDATMRRYFEDLRRWRPVHLQAYPTPLEIFASFLLREGLRLAIPSIACTAEPLLPRQREVIERAFGVRPFNWYGAREGGRIATECARHDGLHVNSYGVYVEAVTETEASVGGARRLVFTDLWNVGFPLIRYDTADLGVLDDEPCGCGCALPRLRDLEGRIADCLVNSRGQRIPGVSLTNRILSTCVEIREMQVLQHTIRSFEIRVVPGPEWATDSAKRIASTLATFVGDDIEVQVAVVPAIPREASGKLRFCKNLLE